MQSSTIVQYRDRPYHLDLIYNQGIVKVTLKHQNSLYQNSFDKSFIEQLTRKTGNFKKFEIFVEMLFKCCKNEDKILSFSVKEFGEDYDRLYVVLTYSVAYDRVHYPLPLDLYATKSIDIASMNYKTLFNNSVNSKQSLKSSNSKDRQIRQLHIRSPSRKRTNHLNYNSMLRTVIAIKKSVSLRDYASAYRGLEDLENELRRANSNDNESRDYKGIQQRIISSPEPRKYKVIKSEPLTEKPRFKRFDPTEYIRQKEARLERQRSLSRTSSRMSRSNSTEPTSFRKTHFTTDFSQSLNSTGAPSRSRVRDSPRRSSDLMARTNDSIQKSIIKSKESSRSRTLRTKSSKDVVLEQKTPDDSRLDLEIQGLQIDERLARLQTFLETTMQ